jgi:hypothetical protein
MRCAEDDVRRGVRRSAVGPFALWRLRDRLRVDDILHRRKLPADRVELGRSLAQRCG